MTGVAEGKRIQSSGNELCSVIEVPGESECVVGSVRHPAMETVSFQPQKPACFRDMWQLVVGNIILPVSVQPFSSPPQRKSKENVKSRLTPLQFVAFLCMNSHFKLYRDPFSHLAC